MIPICLFFCFQSALRQWRRGNIALITTLPVPGCLYSGCNICRKDLGRQASASHEKTFNKETSTNSTRLSCRVIVMPVQASHHDPLHSAGSPILDGGERQTLQQWANTDHKSKTKTKAHNLVLPSQPDSSASSGNLQPKATSSTRDSDRSILAEEDHIQREVTSQNQPYILAVLRGVSWSEVATVPKRKSHRGLDLDLSLNSEVNIRKGWKENSGTK